MEFSLRVLPPLSIFKVHYLYIFFLYTKLYIEYFVEIGKFNILLIGEIKIIVLALMFLDFINDIRPVLYNVR